VSSLKSIVTRFHKPLFAINLAMLAVSAAWLSDFSQWQVMWIGVVMLLFSPMIIPLILLPAGIFSHFMTVYHAMNDPRRERHMFVLSLGYIILFLALWCAGIFDYVMQNVSPRAAEPAVLWADAAAMAPLLWWSSRDTNNIFILLLVQSAQLGVIGLAAVWLWHGPIPFGLMFPGFTVYLAAVATVQGLYEKRLVK
jgi:hypothetical protein